VFWVVWFSVFQNLGKNGVGTITPSKAPKSVLNTANTSMANMAIANARSQPVWKLALNTQTQPKNANINAKM
jgi:hypothetical protein